MIKKIFITQLNQTIVINQPVIVIKFNDVKNYREFCYNLNNSIIYSINNIEKNISNILFIKDPMNIELNDKKILMTLYKNLVKYINLNFQEQILKIEHSILELLDELSYQSEYNLNYDGELDINKILVMYQLCLKENKCSNFLEFLIIYIKTNIELGNYDLIISFGLIKLLEEEELKLLEKELMLLNISIIDIIIDKNYNKINYLNIDSDWNIF